MHSPVWVCSSAASRILATPKSRSFGVLFLGTRYGGRNFRKECSLRSCVLFEVETCGSPGDGVEEVDLVPAKFIRRDDCKSSGGLGVFQQHQVLTTNPRKRFR